MHMYRMQECLWVQAFVHRVAWRAEAMGGLGGEEEVVVVVAMIVGSARIDLADV